MMETTSERRSYKQEWFLAEYTAWGDLQGTTGVAKHDHGDYWVFCYAGERTAFGRPWIERLVYRTEIDVRVHRRPRVAPMFPPVAGESRAEAR